MRNYHDVWLYLQYKTFNENTFLTMKYYHLKAFMWRWEVSNLDSYETTNSIVNQNNTSSNYVVSFIRVACYNLQGVEETKKNYFSSLLVQPKYNLTLTPILLFQLYPTFFSRGDHWSIGVDFELKLTPNQPRRFPFKENWRFSVEVQRPNDRSDFRDIVFLIEKNSPQSSFP